MCCICNAFMALTRVVPRANPSRPLRRKGFFVVPGPITWCVRKYRKTVGGNEMVKWEELNAEQQLEVEHQMELIRRVL